jgi:hypothetical protein
MSERNLVAAALIVVLAAWVAYVITRDPTVRSAAIYSTSIFLGFVIGRAAARKLP